MINRLILWLSLAGMILALHLWIQKSRGFDQGCLGLGKPALATDLGCQSDELESASYLFGVSNAAWGYAFYFGMAFLSLAKIVSAGKWPGRFHLLGELGVTVAMAYSAYLLYFQAFVAHAYCVLCLTSVAIVTAMFALHVVLRLRGGFQPVPETGRMQELAAAAAAAFGAMGVLAGVLLLIDKVGTRALDQGATGKELESIIGETLPKYIDPAKLQEERPCRLDREAPRLDLDMFLKGMPFIGKAGGVPVVIFYDPNCPHCKVYNDIFMKIAEHYKDRARFYIIPRVLWSFSIPQTEALTIAAKEGHYYEMWQREFDHQGHGERNMTQPEIEAMFHDLGLNADNLPKRLAAARGELDARTDMEKLYGISSTPTIYVNGFKVFELNHSEDCMDTLIERAAPAAKPAAAASAVAAP